MTTRTSPRTLRRTTSGLAAVAIALLGMLPSGHAEAAPVPEQAVPRQAPEPGPTPVPHLAIEGSPGCTRVATTTSCTLYARTGSAMVDGSTALDVWVFDDVDSGPVDLLNPVIEMVEGDTLEVTLDNLDVPTSVSLSMPVAPGVPDSAGIGAGDAPKLYTFTDLAAGTYLYQAGPTPTGSRQIAMGMAGVIIVRPAEFTTDGTPPTIDLVTSDDGAGVYTVEAIVADEAGGSGVDVVEWYETDPVGTPTALAATGGVITPLALGDDITVSATDLAGNSTTVALIVGDPGPTTVTVVGDAYTDSHRLDAGHGATEFLDEILAVTNEFDPGLNAAPLTYDIAQYSPTVFTINGQSHDGAVTLPEMQAGTQLLIRAANAGLQQRRIGFADTRLTQFTAGSRFLAEAADVTAVTLPPGDVADAKAVMPLETPVTVALFDHHLSSFVGHSPAVAGQVQVWNLPGVGDPTGPKVEGLRFDPNSHGPNDVVDGATSLDFLASVTTAGPPPMVRYFIDDLTGPSTNVFVAPYGSPYSIDDSVPSLVLSGLPNGEHVLWMQAGTSDGSLWGPVTGLVFEMDREGPVMTALAVDPGLTNDAAGTVVTVTGTADTTLTGPGSPVQVVKYVIDAAPPATWEMPTVGTELTLDGANAERASFTGQIPTAGLAEGVHTIHVYAQDSWSQICCDGAGVYDHWSQVVGTITFVIDTTAPVVDTVAIAPNPNDGTMAFPGGQAFLPSVRLDATILGGEVAAAGSSGIVDAEFWLDDGTPAPAEGDGGQLISTTARWSDLVDTNGESCDAGETCSYVQNVYTEIPLADIRSLAVGDHTFYVRGRDAAGNWSDPAPVVFTLTAPLPTLDLSGLVANEVHFSAFATNGVVDLVEWWYTAGGDPGVGAGTVVYSAATNPDPDLPTVTGDITGLVVGDEISVRVTNTEGGQMVVDTTVIDVTAPVIDIVNDGPRLTFDVVDETAIGTLEWWYVGVDPAPEVGLGTAIPVAAGPFVLPLAAADEIVIRAVDSVGLVTEIGVTIQADVEAPVIANVTTGPGAGEVTFDVTDAAPSSGISTVEWWYDTDPGTITDAGAGLLIAGDLEYVGLVLTGLDPDAAITIRVADVTGNTSTATATTGA